MATAESVYIHKVKDIDGKEIDLGSFKGKIALIVNVASKCGFTSQYKGLEDLYRKYKDRGLVVLGFPSNDFMGQEPGTEAEIKKFCSLNYDVTFPMFSKGPVTGNEKQPVFKTLTEASAADLNGEVRWNFEKFLVDKEGNLVDRWRSITGPSSSKISEQIERLLNG